MMTSCVQPGSGLAIRRQKPQPLQQGEADDQEQDERNDGDIGDHGISIRQRAWDSDLTLSALGRLPESPLSPVNGSCPVGTRCS